LQPKLGLKPPSCWTHNKPGPPDKTIEDEADEKALDEISDRSQQAGYPGDAIPALRALHKMWPG